MQTASMIGGYGASIRPTPPAMHKYVTTGSLPFVAVYCAIEVIYICLIFKVKQVKNCL